MIGNDIVDRLQARKESNWQRRGFLDKLFTAHEQRLVRTANDPECMVWLLWSMKESAYKANARQTGARAFNPTKISCTLSSRSGSTVEGVAVYEQAYQTRSVVTSDYIASLAVPKGFSPEPVQVIVPLTGADYQSQSGQLRARLVQHLAALYSIQQDNVQISNDSHNGPVLVIAGIEKTEIHLPVTISHHGHYGAYSIPHRFHLA